jgi:signal recognition particle receptor subunit alpha
LTRTKTLFLSLFSPYLQSLIASLSTSTISSTSSSALKSLKEQIEKENWTAIFERCLAACEGRADQKGGKKSGPNNKREEPKSSSTEKPRADEREDRVPTTDPATGKPLSSEEIAKNIQAFKTRLKTPSSSKPSSPSSKSSPRPKMGKKGSATEKVMRKWGFDGNGTVSESDMAELDFSGPDTRPSTPGVGPGAGTENLIDKESMGKIGKDGFYEVAEWDTGKGDGLISEEEILERGKKYNLGFSFLSLNGQSEKSDPVSNGQAESRLTSLFNRLTGKKVLNKEDLDPVLREMEKHLMGKNVAKDIAEKLCEGVGAALVGKKLGGMTSRCRQ